jgi:catechol 2,3-dioxygenase-like lactoylglutathione lyase family enzyme
MEPTNSPAPWRLGALHHIGMTVSDIEQSIHFYRDVLGMKLIRRRPRIDSEYVATQTGFSGVVLNVASFQVAEGSAQTLEIAQYMTHAGPVLESASNRPGASHVCITVDDLRACHAVLSTKGVRFKSDPVRITEGPNADGWVVYFYDPDGHLLELFQAPER